MPRNLLLAACGLLLGLAPVQATAATDVRLPSGTLTAKEVVKLFSNRTVETRTVVKKRESLTYYHPDGEVVQLRNGNTRRGFWRVRKDARICLQMEELEEKCARFWLRPLWITGSSFYGQSQLFSETHAMGDDGDLGGQMHTQSFHRNRSGKGHPGEGPR